eukprot:1551197-Amphidinium_carterae.1
MNAVAMLRLVHRLQSFDNVANFELTACGTAHATKLPQGIAVYSDCAIILVSLVVPVATVGCFQSLCGLA